MFIVGFVIALIIIVIVGVALYFSKKNEWKLLPNNDFLVRRNPDTGIVECLSYDGVNCHPSRIKPISCDGTDFVTPPRAVWCKTANDLL